MDKFCFKLLLVFALIGLLGCGLSDVATPMPGNSPTVGMKGWVQSTSQPGGSITEYA